MAMGIADLHNLELSWPSPHPTDVVVTGTFDQWSSSIHLVKGNAGFFGTVKVPWGQKVAYKFIVDGHWQCRDDFPQEDDGHGNINNVLQTPEKPQAAFPVVHDSLARLSIPLEGAESRDVETMVTAVEFLPPAEPIMARGLFPLPIPHISVEGVSLSSSADTSVSVSKLDTATATEGTVPPALHTLEELTSLNQASSSSGVSILPITDNGPVLLPLVNEDGETRDSHGSATHATIQLTKGMHLPSPVVLETVKETLSTPFKPIVLQSNPSPQGTQDAPASTDRIGIPPSSTPAAALEPIAKQPKVDLETMVQGRHLQDVTPTSIGQASTLTHKKRRSLFARIKYMFNKDNDKRKKGGTDRH